MEGATSSSAGPDPLLENYRTALAIVKAFLVNYPSLVIKSLEATTVWMVIRRRGLMGTGPGPAELWLKYSAEAKILEMDFNQVTPFRSLARTVFTGIGMAEIAAVMLDFLISDCCDLNPADVMPG